MIEKGFQTQHVAMATKNLCVCLLLMLNHKCGKFYLDSGMHWRSWINF